MPIARGFIEEERIVAEATAEERHPGEVVCTRKMIHVLDVPNDLLKQTASSLRSVTVRSRLWIPVGLCGPHDRAAAGYPAEPRAAPVR